MYHVDLRITLHHRRHMILILVQALSKRINHVGTAGEYAR